MCPSVSIFRRRSPWTLLAAWICVAAAGAPFPVDDAYEPNEVPPLAFDLRGHEGNWLSTHSGSPVQFDDDWYLVEVGPGRHQLNIEFTFPTTAHINVVVLGPDNAELTARWWSGSTSGLVELDVPTPGIHRVKVGGDNRGAAYDLRWNAPADDRYEPNNTLAEAYELSSQAGFYGSDTHPPLVQADEDWYRIEVPAGSLRVLAECRFTHAEGDIDVALCDAGGNPIMTSQSTSDHELIDTTVGAPGTYYLHVYYGGAGNPYRLCWWTLSGDPAGDDAYEPNDTITGAHDLTANEGQWISTIAGNASWLDLDCYVVETAPGDHSVRVECDIKDPGVTQGWISLYDDDGEWLTNSNFPGGQGSVEARFPVPAAGRYLVVVEAWVSPEGTPIDYDLRWHGDPDDAWEENDDFSTAATDNWGPLPLSLLYEHGAAYQLDDDWYQCYGTPGQDLVVECLFEHAEGDIDIALYEANGSFVTNSPSTTDNERIEYTVPGSGGAVPFLVRVSYGNAGNRYDLSYNTRVPQPIPGDDAYEPNDSLSAAFDLSGDRGRWFTDLAGMATQMDDDWFRVETAPGDEWLVVEACFPGEYGPYIEVWDRWGRKLWYTGSTSPSMRTDRTTSLVPIPAPGSYFIRVTCNPPAGAYNLRWDVFPATISAPSWDPFEYNDSFSWACDLSRHEQVLLSELGATGILRGEDWYRVLAGPGERRLVVDCSHVPAEGDISMHLVDSHGVTVAVAEVHGESRRLDLIVPAEGEYYLRVFGGSDGQSYDLRWNDLATFGPACAPPRVAYFANQQYLYGGFGSPGGEGGRLLRDLLEDPDTAEVRTFTGTSADAFRAALEDADILCIPSLLGTDLATDLAPDARAVINGFVTGGGGLLVFGDYDDRSAGLVNDVFGIAVATGPDIWSDEYPRLPDALDTAWEFGLRSISQVYDEHPWRTGSLPGGSSAVYGFDELGTNYAVVAHLPIGVGNLVFSQWGYTSLTEPDDGTYGGWSDVLDRALEQCYPCTPPASRIEAIRRFAPTFDPVVLFEVEPRLHYWIEYRANNAPGATWTPFVDSGSWINETGFPGWLGFSDDFTPTTSGGPPVEGRRFYRIGAEIPADIAIYTDPGVVDPFFVEMMGTGLERLRHISRRFSGVGPDEWAAAMDGTHALVIPSLTVVDLTAILPPETFDVLQNAIADGRTLVLTGDSFGHAAALANTLLGAPAALPAGSYSAQPMFLEPDLPIPALDGAPPDLAGNAWMHPWDRTDVVATGGFSAFSNASYTGVAWIPHGAGEIVYLGWDWTDARPVGPFDGGWLEILDRITHP